MMGVAVFFLVGVVTVSIDDLDDGTTTACTLVILGVLWDKGDVRHSQKRPLSYGIPCMHCLVRRCLVHCTTCGLPIIHTRHLWL